MWDKNQEEDLLLSCATKVQDAVEEYLNRPPQPITSAFDYHFETLPDYLIEQRAIAMEDVANG